MSPISCGAELTDPYTVYGSATSTPKLIGDIVSLFMSKGAMPAKSGLARLGMRAILAYPAGKNSAGKEA
jgi:hypothetical protein